MKINKFGHSCLLVEEGNARILIDPGNYSVLQNDVKNLDAVLITHEHSDHLDLNSLGIILKNNQGVNIFTNKVVGKKLDEQAISYQLLENGQQTEVKGVAVEGAGERHAFIYNNFPDTANVGYIIGGKFYDPGDSFFVPNKKIEVLALPISASWLKTAEVIEYAKRLMPKNVFPIHDGMVRVRDSFYGMPSRELPTVGINWTVIKDGQSAEF